MKKQNVIIQKNIYYHLALEGEGGTKCRVREKDNKANLRTTPSSVLWTSSPSRGKGLYGFTLIELLVVVLIIGILAAVAVPQYKKAVEKTRLSEAVLTISSMQKAANLYVLTHGYPFLTEGFVYFLETEDLLDIVGTLNCTDHMCSSKYFVYEAKCYDGKCFVAAFRRRNGDPEEETEYVLDTNSDSSGIWNNNCYYYTSTYPYGKNMCKSLETQGWNAALDE